MLNIPCAVLQHNKRLMNTHGHTPAEKSLF